MTAKVKPYEVMKGCLVLRRCLVANMLAVSALGTEAPQILWGGVTNELLQGVQVQSKLTKGNESYKHTILYLGTTNLAQTNLIYRPSRTEIFKLSLRDQTGKEVPKTKLGKSFGDEPSKTARIQDRTIRQWRIVILPQEWDVQMASFNLMDHFALTKPGDYELTVESRVYTTNGKGDLELITLPPCTVKFRFDP